MVIMLIVLDSAPLSLLAHPAARSDVVAWAARVLGAGHRLVIPEITDYEVRRKLLYFVRGRYPLNTGEAGERLHEPHPLGEFIGGQARNADPLMGTRVVLVLKAHQ